jgi:heme/copper-type cytochrome/quinol oxidase subunit 2
MMVLAVGTRSSILGALILCAFVIGTSPVFFTIGLATQELMKKKSFMYIASFVIVILGILSINSGQTIRGSSQTLQNYFTVIKTTFSDTIASTPNDLAKVDNQGKQIVTIDATSNGYSSQVKTLKVGIPVKLTLASHNVQSCARSFLIPSVGISKILPENGAIEIEFTPTKTGTLAYTCGMGMYSGSFTVI